jgi:aryl-alcohol dehydrogenase-like predicted oxidoreductase
MRIALGTAQFGQDYGITNSVGQITAESAFAILARARDGGIDTIDTAIAYGRSEQLLGDAGVDGWRVVSKLPSYPYECSDVKAWVNANVDDSLARLKIPQLHGLLLHRPDQLLGSRGSQLYSALLTLKAAGKVKKIGISIYDPTELDLIFSRYQFDLVQAPFNIFDRRLASSGWMSKLHASSVEIHVRSVFLQGLLLKANGFSPSGFERWEDLWISWGDWIKNYRLNPLLAALGHVLSYPEIDRVIVGVDNLAQLNEILACAQFPHQRVTENLATNDLDLLNPSRWSNFL